MSVLRKIDLKGRDRLAPKEITKPAMSWLPISDLRIDDTYQRPILHRGWKQIEWIAEHFTWVSFSPAIVSRIKNGQYALIDGQHRAHAALLAGHDAIPALCVEIDQVEQARAFSRVNGRVTNLTSHAIFKAALIAKEKWALDCDRVVSESGCRLMQHNASTQDKKPGEIYAVTVIKEMVANMEGEAVTAGLRALRKSVFGGDTEIYCMQTLKPWLKAIASNSAYLHIDLVKALDFRVDLYALMNKATKEAKETRESKQKILRQMICYQLDKGREKISGHKVVRMKRAGSSA